MDVLRPPEGTLSTKQAGNLLRTLKLEHMIPLLEEPEFNQDKISMGEKQRLMLAQALQLPPQSWLFLDEPTSHLNQELGSAIMEQILDHNNNHSVVVISHNTYPDHWFNALIEIGNTIEARLIETS
jgi:ABC-type transport system involved in cytochrome bd biosynthesis fused ATPase/permease subunit